LQIKVRICRNGHYGQLYNTHMQKKLISI